MADDGAVRTLTVGDLRRALVEFVREAKAGEDGPETYEWDEGIPP